MQRLMCSFVGPTYFHTEQHFQHQLSCAENDDVDCHDWQSLAPFRKAFKGPFIAAGGFTPQSALKEVASGASDIVAIGRW